MENSNNQNQSFEESFKQSLTQNPPQPSVSPYQTQQTSTTPKRNHKKTILFTVFITSSIVLLIIGLIIQSNAILVTNSGQTEQEVLKSINSLESEITQLEESQSKIFESSGFSEEYYEAANKTAEKVLLKDNLLNELSSLNPQSITQSGTIWLFVAAGVALLISLIILFLNI